jgi:hypothetical protein
MSFHPQCYQGPLGWDLYERATVHNCSMYYLGAEFMAQALPIHNKARFTGAQTYAEVSVTIIFWYIFFHAGGSSSTKIQESKIKKRTKFGPGEKKDERKSRQQKIKKET